MKEISAGIIIYKREKDVDGKTETKYLLLYHGRGYWNFPKGKLEKGERSYQTAFREVSEETGISPRSLRLEKNFKLADKYIFQRGGEKRYKIVLFYLAKASSSYVRLSLKHTGQPIDGYGWFLHQEAQRYLKHGNLKSILKKAHEHIRSRYRITPPSINKKSSSFKRG